MKKYLNHAVMVILIIAIINADIAFARYVCHALLPVNGVITEINRGNRNAYEEPHAVIQYQYKGMAKTTTASLRAGFAIGDEIRLLVVKNTGEAMDYGILAVGVFFLLVQFTLLTCLSLKVKSEKTLCVFEP